MTKPKKAGRKVIKWVLAALAVLVAAIAVAAALNWTYVKAVLQVAGILPMPTPDSVILLEEQPASSDSTASAAPTPTRTPGSASASVSSAASEEEEEHAASEETGAASQEEAAQPEPAVSPTQPASSVSPAHTAQPSASPAASSASPSASPTPTPTPESTAPAYQQELDEQIAAMHRLEDKFESQLYQIIWDAYDEYMALPEESRNLLKKISIVLSKKSALSAMEAECDKEVAAVVANMRRILKENGQSTELADQAEKTYKDKKSALMAELITVTYSGGDGTHPGGAWIQEHAPR